MTRSVLLAYDVGTSGLKAVVSRPDGTVLASRSLGYSLRTGTGGAVEQDLDEIRATIGIVTRDLVDSGVLPPRQLEAIAVTAQMFNVVPVRSDGSALGPMISWLDQRAAGHAARLAARLPLGEQFEVFDAVLTAKDLVPRIHWLTGERPDIARHAAWYLDCKEAVVVGFTGRAVTDVAGASAYRLLDFETVRWSTDRAWAAAIDPGVLPEVAGAFDRAGVLLDGPASVLGLLAGTPVAVGTGDVPASQVGAGAAGHGDIHLSLGTAIYFGISLDVLLHDPARRLGVIGHMTPGRFILWLETATGGGALAWLSRIVGDRAASNPGGFASVDEEVDACAGETDDLLFAPWLSGERVPLFDDAIRGAFVGLGLHHGRPHLVRAVMEGVAYQMRWAFEYGLAFGVKPGVIRAVGGGSVSRSWLQIIADVLGHPIEVVGEPEHAAARAALLAAASTAGVRETQRRAVVRVERSVTPEPANRSRYEAGFARFRRLYDALAPLHEAAPTPPGPPRAIVGPDLGSTVEIGAGR